MSFVAFSAEFTTFDALMITVALVARIKKKKKKVDKHGSLKHACKNLEG